jgi:hypothetical protein
VYKSFGRKFGKKNFKQFGKKILGKPKKVFGKPDSQKVLEKLWQNVFSKIIRETNKKYIRNFFGKILCTKVSGENLQKKTSENLAKKV